MMRRDGPAFDIGDDAGLGEDISRPRVQRFKAVSWTYERGRAEPRRVLLSSRERLVSQLPEHLYARLLRLDASMYNTDTHYR